MTPSEKRYYKLQNSSGKSDTLHNQLFDYLNSLSEYKEEQVRQYFEESIGDNLKVYKSQLQERILKSLRSYHQDKSVRSQARNLLHDIEILLEKGLHEIARQKLEKLKRLCRKHEEFELLLVALGVEARLSTYFISSQRDAEQVVEDFVDCIQTIDEYVQQAKLNQKLLRNYSDLSHTAVVRQKFEEAVHQQAAFQDQHFKSFIARRMYQHSIVLSHLDGDCYKEASEAYKKVLEEFDKRPHLKKSHLLAYFNCLINLLSVCNFDESCEETEKIAQDIDAILKKNPHLERFSIHPLYYRIYGLRKQGKWKACTEMAERTYRVACRHELLEEPIAQMSFLAAFQAHLVLGNYSAKGQQPFIDFFRREQYLPLPTRQISYLLEMLQFYVSDNEDVLDSFISALGRRLYRRKEDDEDLRYYRNFFKHLLRSPLAERPAVFQKALKYYEDNKKSKLHQSLAECFDWPEWLAAQMKGVEYKTYLAG